MEMTWAPSLRPSLIIDSIRDVRASMPESVDGSESTPCSVRADSAVTVAGDDINRAQQSAGGFAMLQRHAFET